MYSPPIIDSLQLTSGQELRSLTLDTDSIQLPGFMGFKDKVGEKEATRFISLSSIEQFIITADELDKVMPCSFIPETRLRVRQEH